MLFKYLPARRIAVLDNFLIRFTQMSQLNDPFESAIILHANDELKKLDPTSDFLEMVKKNGISPTNDEESEFFQQALIDLENYWKEKIDPCNIGRELISQLDLAQGVLSLSRTNSSLLMWAHYSDSHQGFVLGLDESHPFFREKDMRGRETSPKNVIYSSTRNISKVDSEDAYQHMLCHKSIEWSYEEEVRIFRTFGKSISDFEKNKTDQVHLFKLPKECIKSVHIGANASLELRENIKKLVLIRKLDVEIFEASISKDKYEINHSLILVDKINNFMVNYFYSVPTYRFPFSEIGFTSNFTK